MEASDLKILCKCSPPMCFELERYTSIDGKSMIAITDAQGGVAIDTEESFDRMIYEYLKVTRKCEI